jgi:hypothetical protein
MKSFSINDWLSAAPAAGKSLSPLSKPDPAALASPPAAGRIEMHGQRARVYWHHSQRHFRPALLYLARAFSHGVTHLILRAGAFLRRQLRRMGWYGRNVHRNPPLKTGHSQL